MPRAISPAEGEFPDRGHLALDLAVGRRFPSGGRKLAPWKPPPRPPGRGRAGNGSLPCGTAVAEGAALGAARGRDALGPGRHARPGRKSRPRAIYRAEGDFPGRGRVSGPRASCPRLGRRKALPVGRTQACSMEATDPSAGARSRGERELALRDSGGRRSGAWRHGRAGRPRSGAPRPTRAEVPVEGDLPCRGRLPRTVGITNRSAPKVCVLALDWAAGGLLPSKDAKAQLMRLRPSPNVAAAAGPAAPVAGQRLRSTVQCRGESPRG